MRWLEKYVRTFMLSIQSSMEYRANFMMSLISSIFPMLMQVFLWTAIFNSSLKSAVYGYTYAQMIAYSVIANIVGKLIGTGIEFEISADIKGGGLNKYIVRPVGYIFYRLCNFLGQKSIQAGILVFVLFGTLVLLAKYQGLQIELTGVVFFFMALLLALILNFLIFFCISTISFWVLEVYYLFEAATMMILVLSGGVFPLDIFGSEFIKYTNYLPFKYTINFPVDVISGKLGYELVVQGILFQILWIGIVAIISKILWTLGTKKYCGVG